MVRYKNRYVTVQVHPIESISKKMPIKNFDLNSAIENAVQDLHGDIGVGSIRLGFGVRYCNEHTRIAIIRASLGTHRLITSSLPFIKKIGKFDVKIHIIYIGATLRQCFKAIMKYQRQSLIKIWAQLSDEEKKDYEEKYSNIMDVNFENTSAITSVK